MNNQVKLAATIVFTVVTIFSHSAKAEEPKIGTVKVGVGLVSTKCEVRWGMTKIKIFGRTITKTKVPKTYCGL